MAFALTVCLRLRDARIDAALRADSAPASSVLDPEDSSSSSAAAAGSAASSPSSIASEKRETDGDLLSTAACFNMYNAMWDMAMASGTALSLCLHEDVYSSAAGSSGAAADAAGSADSAAEASVGSDAAEYRGNPRYAGIDL